MKELRTRYRFGHFNTITPLYRAFARFNTIRSLRHKPRHFYTISTLQHICQATQVQFYQLQYNQNFKSQINQK